MDAASPLYWPIRLIAFLLSLYTFLTVHSSSLDAEGLVHLRNLASSSSSDTNNNNAATASARERQTSLVEPMLAAAVGITLIHSLRTGSLSFLVKSFFLFPLSLLCFLCLFVLLGSSPASVLNAEMLLFSPAFDLALLLATVGVLPTLCAVEGSLQPHVWQTVLFRNHQAPFSHNSLLLSPVFPSLCAAFLCALSSIVLPLDWGTSWQIFPYANLVGCAAGFMIGTTLQVVVSLFRSSEKSSQS